MANSVMPGEDESWAQTFVTVTPQEDGFLREIEENVVVSGPGDSPIQLDTWNIVLRRSLVKSTRDWIEPAELERSTSPVGVECQTYLQGVPRVELPRAYVDEATQTLYMGRNGAAQYFDDIINVLNEKPLPELRSSHAVQTVVSTGSEATDIITKLKVNEDPSVPNDSPSFAETSEKEAALTEAEDILNFVVERALWIARSGPPQRGESREIGTQTSIKYDHRTAKLTVEYEVQTDLTCEPRHSNSMLLSGYNETRQFCRDRVDECLERGVYPRIAVKSIVDEIMTNCGNRTELPSREVADKNVESSANVYRDEAAKKPEEKTTGVTCKNPWCKNRRETVHAEKPRVVYVGSSSDASSTSSSLTSGSSESSWRQTSTSLKSLSLRNEQALCSLRSAFCVERGRPPCSTAMQHRTNRCRNELGRNVRQSDKSSERYYSDPRLRRPTFKREDCKEDRDREGWWE